MPIVEVYKVKFRNHTYGNFKIWPPSIKKVLQASKNSKTARKHKLESAKRGGGWGRKKEAWRNGGVGADFSIAKNLTPVISFSMRLQN